MREYIHVDAVMKQSVLLEDAYKNTDEPIHKMHTYVHMHISMIDY